MVRSGRRHNSCPCASLVRYMRLRMSSPDRSRKGPAGCRMGGTTRRYPARWKAAINASFRVLSAALIPAVPGGVSCCGERRLACSGVHFDGKTQTRLTRAAVCSLNGLSPVAEHRPHEGKCGNGSRIGGQNAGPKGQPYGVGQRAEHSAFLGRKAPVRADQTRKRDPLTQPAEPHCGKRRNGVANVCLLVTEDQQPVGGTVRDHAFKAQRSRISGSIRRPHCWAASIAFARMRARLTRLTWVWRVITGCRRDAPISTAFWVM